MMDLLRVAEAVANEKSIDREDVLQAMEEAIKKAGRSKYGQEQDIRAHIDRKLGTIKLLRYLEIIDGEPENSTQISLKLALKKNPNAKIGEHIIDTLPNIDFSRMAAQSAKQVITQKVRDAERRHQYELYKDRIGELVQGEIKHIDRNGVILDINRTEAFLSRDKCILWENFRNNFTTSEKIHAIVSEVRQENHGPQIFLSRVAPEFLKQLFILNIPEIADGIIEIKAIARDPGSHAKVAVTSYDNSIDPVSVCIGKNSRRIQPIIKELQGEKIDVIFWSKDFYTFLVNAFTSTPITKVIPTDDAIEVVVPDSYIRMALGRRKQNVHLISQLTNMKIKVSSETEETERNKKERKVLMENLINALQIDDVLAHYLVNEKFETVEDIAYCSLEELTVREELNDELATKLQERAQEYLLAEYTQLQERYKELDIQQDLADLTKWGLPLLIKLGDNGIKTQEDLANLSSDELLEIVEFSIDPDEADHIIMNARRPWFEDKDRPWFEDEDIAEDNTTSRERKQS